MVAIDTAENTVAGELPTASGPLGVAIDSTGRILVASGNAGVLSVLEPSGAAAGSVVVGALPVAFGAFAGTVANDCPAAAPSCADADPGLAGRCAPQAGCAFNALPGLDALGALLDALDETIRSAPAGSIRDPGARADDHRERRRSPCGAARRWHACTGAAHRIAAPRRERAQRAPHRRSAARHRFPAARSCPARAHAPGAGPTPRRTGAAPRGRRGTRRRTAGSASSVRARLAFTAVLAAATLVAPPAARGGDDLEQDLRPPGDKRWSVYATSGLQYDSNVCLSPSGQPLPGCPANPADGAITVGAGGRYSLLDTARWQASLEYDLYQTLHFREDMKDFNLRSNRVVRAGRLRAHTQLWMGVQAGYQHYALGGEGYSGEPFVTPFVSLIESGWGLTQLLYRHATHLSEPPLRGRPRRPDRHGESEPDGVLGARLFRRSATSSGRERPRAQTPAADDYRYRYNQGHAGVGFSPGWQTSVELTYLFRYENYTEPNSFADDPPERDVRTPSTSSRSPCSRPLTPHLASDWLLWHLGQLEHRDLPVPTATSCRRSSASRTEHATRHAFLSRRSVLAACRARRARSPGAGRRRSPRSRARPRCCTRARAPGRRSPRAPGAAGRPAPHPGRRQAPRRAARRIPSSSWRPAPQLAVTEQLARAHRRLALPAPLGTLARRS